MTFAKFEENRFRIDGEITENHAILGNLTASITTPLEHVEVKFKHDIEFIILAIKLKIINQDRMIFGDFSVSFEPISGKFCRGHFLLKS